MTKYMIKPISIARYTLSSIARLIGILNIINLITIRITSSKPQIARLKSMGITKNKYKKCLFYIIYIVL